MSRLGIMTLVAALGWAGGIEAAAQEVEGPRAAVDQLFLGMRMGDARIAQEVLAPDVRFAVVEATDGETTIVTETLDTFLLAVAASQGAWNEQIYDVEVLIDDHVASVWAPYTFYLGGRISHCGVNSFELLRDGEGWKITQISDTRRMEGCPDPLEAR